MMIRLVFFIGVVFLIGCSDHKGGGSFKDVVYEKCLPYFSQDNDSEVVEPFSSRIDCQAYKDVFDEVALAKPKSTYYITLSFLLALTFFGGVLGAVMDAYGGMRKRSAGRGSRKNSRYPWAFKGVVGIGASLVGITFLGSFVHLRYDDLVISSSLKIANFIETSVSVLGLSVLSGFLGIRLVAKVADGLLQKKLDDLAKTTEEATSSIEDQLKASIDELEDQLLAERFRHDGWWAILKGCDLDEDVSIQYISDGVRNLKKSIELNNKAPEPYAWLAFGLKRLGKIQEAIESITKAIEIEPSVKRYYNRACYKVLNGDSISKVISDLDMAFFDEQLIEGYTEGDFESLVTAILGDSAKDRDEDFDTVRDTPEFQKFLMRLREKYRSNNK